MMKFGPFLSLPARAWLCLAFCLLPALAEAQESGSAAVVVYNKRMGDSKKVAFHYARRRDVPMGQIIGLDLPETETMTRAEFDGKLRKPLLEFLKSRGLLTFRPGIDASANSAGGAPGLRVASARIRYIVLCFGVPLIIQRDNSLSEPAAAALSPLLQARNEAAVDSELALLPASEAGYPLAGSLSNPFFGATNAALFNPTNNILMVARLDGPTFAIANALVDKAMLAEEQGLWGRAYFDLRGLTNGDYKMGDDWIRTSSEVCRILGFETVVDSRPETFPADFPMSQVAIYAGWYDANVSGPFARGSVEFMPGAVAYHLHSYSAHSIRTLSESWVGPLLARGATATMGSVDEPYLAGTPDVGVFFSRFIGAGFSFGEAAYAGIAGLSWQTTVVGDPLYRPFAMAPQERHEKLLREKSRMVEWSFLRVVNMNLAAGTPAVRGVEYLENEPQTRGSAVLMEKLGELYEMVGKPASSIYATQSALKLNPTPLQTLRLLQVLGERLEGAGRLVEARDCYSRIFKEFPSYGDREGLRARIVELTTKSGAPPSSGSSN